MTTNAARVITHLQGDRFVYCCQAWQRAAAMITLRIPITSPPVDVSSFDPRWMEGKPLLIFKLHGEDNDPNWYGMDVKGNRTIALIPSLVEAADLKGAIVIAIVCYGLGGRMGQAFYNAGARAVFGSHTEVRGRETQMGEADLLAHILLRRLSQTDPSTGSGQAPSTSLRAGLAYLLTEAKQEYLARKEVPTEHDLYTVSHFAVSLNTMA